ncbi:MAG TPA: hypothetical protein VIN03_19190 [Roseateles sp.]
MWEEDWVLLGIAPTPESAAIKKAYALKLRVTRPDDDAEAYQALRGAYERALQWARSQVLEPQSNAETAVEPVAIPAPQAQQPSVDATPPAPWQPRVQPEALVAEADGLWRGKGDGSLMAAWPALSQRLDNIPLQDRAEFSAAFAHWVLNHPQLPDPLVSALAQQFGWLSDYRAERQIGPELVQALHEALDGRLLGHTATPELRQHAAPLLHLHRVLDRWWGAAAPLLAAAIGPGLDQLLQSLDEGSLRRLGLHPGERQGVTSALDIAAALRFCACVLPLALIAFMHHGQLEKLGWPALAWLISGLVGMGFAWIGSNVLQHGLLPLSLAHRYHGWLQHLRARSWAPWLGLALLAAASWFAWARYGSHHALTHAESVPLKEAIEGVRSIHLIGADTLSTGYWIDLLGPLAAGLAGLTLAWPMARIRGQVLAGQVLLLTYVVQIALEGADNGPLLGLTGPDLIELVQDRVPVIATWFGCWTWLILGSLVYEHRMAGAARLGWVVRPVTNVLGLGERWGLHLAVTPAFVLCGVLCLLAPEMRLGTTLFLWAMLILAVGYLQAALENRGLRWLARLAGQG